jgi:hypothetical protein
MLVMPKDMQHSCRQMFTDSEPTEHLPSVGQHLALTPAGVLHAFSQPNPDEVRAAYQSVLAHNSLPLVSEWIERGPDHRRLLFVGLAAGWLHLVDRNLPAPDVRLDDFLSHVIAGLSGERRAALASNGGFCVGRAGINQAQADVLCAASADYAEFAARQRQRGWHGASHRVSFHEDTAMLLPTASFVPFWIDGVDYCLVLGGEPLVNSPTLVELVWGIKTAGARFSALAGR